MLEVIYGVAFLKILPFLCNQIFQHPRIVISMAMEMGSLSREKTDSSLTRVILHVNMRSHT